MITAGVGLALIGTGVVFGASARSASRDIESLSDDRGQWSPQNQDLFDKGERDEKLAIGFAAAGGAAVLTGGVLYYLGVRDARVTPSASSSSASLNVSWTF